LAEEVLDRLATLGAKMSGPWTKGVALLGGSLSRAELLAVAERGPAPLAYRTRRRLALTYGDQVKMLFARLDADASAAQEIAPGVTRAELEHAVEAEDAMTAEDFLLRRTKLHLMLAPAERDAVAGWFAASSRL